MTWNMARNTEKRENEKCTLYELEYGEKSDQQGKWEIHMVGYEIWKDTLKNLQNEKHTVETGI